MNEKYYFLDKRVISLDFELLKDIYNVIENPSLEDILNGSTALLTLELTKFYLSNPTASLLEIFNKELIIYEEYIETIEDVRNRRLNELHNRYDSKEVKIFYLSGIPLWLDQNSRISYINLINAHIKSNIPKVTLWFNHQSFTLLSDKALLILYELELYASNCFNTTSLHSKNLDELLTKEELELYDITTGYPDKLSFNLNED